ncbi:MAG TPA: cyclase family protein [Sphaerochaeta sp.]|nr:cyclase family protein [Sphaerochaeta sp.]
MQTLVDLTHIIDPEVAQRKFSVETIGAETVNLNVVRSEDQWYIMSNISMVSHIGTHVEVPYHIFKDGKDLSTMEISAFYGEAVMLQFTDIQGRVPISKEQVAAEVERVGGIKAGDIVFCNLGYSSFYGTPRYGESPYFSEEAIAYLAESGMKLMGIDAGGVEIPQSEEHVNHTKLFAHDIPLIENLANLDAITVDRFTVSAFPYPIKGVESFPVRVVAIL